MTNNRTLTTARTHSQRTTDEITADADEQTTDQSGEQTACPDCDTRLKTDDGSERYCPDCGLVVEEDNIDHGPEWRAFNHEERQNKARTGSPQKESIHDKGLSTHIDWRDKDANGRSISQKKRRKMKRLRRWDEQSRTKNSKERNLKKALGEVNRMTSALGLPDDVNEMASVIYRRAVDDDLLVGRSIEGMASAALFCACRKSQIPRTLSRIGEVSRVPQDDISSAYRYLSNELNLELPPADPNKFLPGVASDADVPQKVEAEAANLVSAYVEDGSHSGRNPVGVAAAALYTANKILGSEVSLRQEDVAEAGDVCVVTIRTRYEELITYEGAIESDPEEVSVADNNDGVDTETEETDASDVPSVTTDTVTVTPIDKADDEYLVAIPDDASQNDVLLGVANELVEKFDLLDEIEAPYTPPRCSKTLIVEDPETDAPEQKASWRDLECGLLIDTKRGKGDKECRMDNLADELGITLRFDAVWDEV